MRSPFRFNRSTVQPFNRSTVQPFNRSTVQPFNRSTVQPFNRAISGFSGELVSFAQAMPYEL